MRWKPKEDSSAQEGTERAQEEPERVVFEHLQATGKNLVEKEGFIYDQGERREN